MARRRRRRVSIRRRRRAAPRRRRGGRRRRLRSRLSRLGKRSGFAQMANIAGGLVFFSQLTQAERAAGAYTGTIGDKVKTFVNNVFGNIIGTNVFSSPTPQFQQQFNLDGAFNKFTGIGAASILYSMLPIRRLPHKGKAGTLGKRLLTAGFLGGLFNPVSGVAPIIQSGAISRPLLSSSGSQVTTS